MAKGNGTDNHQSMPFFVIKSLIGFFYYQYLQSRNLTSPKARWITFQLVSPIIKLHHHLRKTPHNCNYSHNNSSSSSKTALLFSIGHDFITSTIYYFIVIRLTGIWYSIAAVPLLFPPIAILEYVFGYKLFQLTKDEYVVKPLRWVDPAAFFGLGVIMFTLLGMTTNDDSPQGQTTTTTTTTTTATTTMPLHKDFVAFLSLLLWTDFQFGITHYISHRIPWLWKKHKIHHEYGKGTLNGWSNLHGDWLDNIQMNGVLLVPILLFAGFGQLYPSLRPFTEWLYLIPFTHLTFQPLVTNLMVFFEWDLLDMLLGANRLGSYHSIHHETVGRNFAIFGIWPDSICKSVGLFFVGDDTRGVNRIDKYDE
jgi:sterol desaturase/sphingolipid hydroxylase (fatty acid hydroxylase superfamily)